MVLILLLLTFFSLRPEFLSGPDGFPAFLFEKMAVSLLLSLYIPFKELNHTGKIPSIWKSALNIFVHKKGMKSAYSNCNLLV